MTYPYFSPKLRSLGITPHMTPLSHLMSGEDDIKTVAFCCSKGCIDSYLTKNPDKKAFKGTVPKDNAKGRVMCPDCDYALIYRQVRVKPEGSKECLN